MGSENPIAPTKAQDAANPGIDGESQFAHLVELVVSAETALPLLKRILKLCGSNPEIQSCLWKEVSGANDRLLEDVKRAIADEGFNYITLEQFCRLLEAAPIHTRVFSPVVKLYAVWFSKTVAQQFEALPDDAPFWNAVNLTACAATDPKLVPSCDLLAILRPLASKNPTASLVVNHAIPDLSTWSHSPCSKCHPQWRGNGKSWASTLMNSNVGVLVDDLNLQQPQNPKQLREFLAARAITTPLRLLCSSDGVFYDANDVCSRVRPSKMPKPASFWGETHFFGRVCVYASKRTGQEIDCAIAKTVKTPSFFERV